MSLETIINAKTPKELFGEPDNPKATKIYKRYLHIAHPDMYSPSDPEQSLAHTAFIKLTKFWDQYNGKVNNEPDKNYIKTKKHDYVIGSLVYDTDGFVSFDAQRDGKDKVYLTFPKNTGNNDLIDTYTQNLSKIKKEVNPEYNAFYPYYLESFQFSIDGKVRSIVAHARPEGFYSLTEVMEDYPEGIHGRDIAWIFKRILIGLGNAHEIGLVHGAINPDSILIHPELHGLVIQNWQYAVEDGQTLSALPASHKALYPSYVFDKKPAHKELDFYLAAKTMELLFRKDMPKALKAFFNGCKLNSMPFADELLGQFDFVLEKVYGAKSFHEFKMKRK